LGSQYRQQKQPTKMADIETIDTINCDVNCLYSNPADMARLIDTSIETRGKKITYDRVTLKKASQKRQFPKHKDRKQNTKKKKLGKIRLNSRRLKKKSGTKRKDIQDFKRDPTFAN
jgi:hypothetical protein